MLLRPTTYFVTLILAALGLVWLGTTPQPAAAQGYWSGGYYGGSYYRYRRNRARRYRRRQQRLRRRRPPRRSVRRKRKVSVPRTTLVRKNTANVTSQLVVSLRDQRVTVYENGRAVARSSVSTGKAGHDTPTGIFSIIQKRRHHRSNIYSGAPMPYMQRITWSGIALHQGKLPGYRASHGCIRLPTSFARDLFRYTQRRTHVVIAHGNPAPKMIEHAGLFMPANPNATPVTGGQAQSAMSNGDVVRVAMNDTAGSRDVLRDAGNQSVLGEKPASLKTALDQIDRNDLLAHRRLMYANRPGWPLRIMVTRRTFREKVFDTQRLLDGLGYDVGGVDGLIGRDTVRAIRSFQSDQGQRPAGYITDEFLQDLYKAAGVEEPASAQVYVRQGGRQIYAGPVQLEDTEAPLGVHLYTMIGGASAAPKPTADRGSQSSATFSPITRWNAITLKAKGRLPDWSRKEWRQRRGDVEPMTAAQALGRIRFPEHVRLRIEDMLTPGSSLIITDGGSDRETGQDTDFVVLTD